MRGAEGDAAIQDFGLLRYARNDEPEGLCKSSIEGNFWGSYKKFVAKTAASGFAELNSYGGNITLSVSVSEGVAFEVLRVIAGYPSDKALFETLVNKFILPNIPKQNIQIELGSLKLPYDDLGNISINSSEKGLSISISPQTGTFSF